MANMTVTEYAGAVKDTVVSFWHGVLGDGPGGHVVPSLRYQLVWSTRSPTAVMFFFVCQRKATVTTPASAVRR